MMALRVVLVDDHVMFREGLRSILSAYEEFDVVGEAADSRTAGLVIEEKQPDLAVLDINLPGVSGLSLARELRRRHPRLKMVFASMHLHDELVVDGLEAGVQGFVLKEQSSSELLEAMRAVSAGRTYFAPQLSQANIEEALHRRRAQGSEAEARPLAALTRREREVFELLIQGFSNQEIGKQLFLSPRTIETHRANVLHKLKADSVAELVLFAARHKLLPLS